MTAKRKTTAPPTYSQRTGRLNVKIEPATYEFIKRAAAVKGTSVTQLVDTILTQYATEHRDTYTKIEQLVNSL